MDFSIDLRNRNSVFASLKMEKEANDLIAAAIVSTRV